MIKGEGVNYNLMGFFKKIIEENINLGEMNCRCCGSYDLTFTKHIGYGSKMGIVYHYKANCNSCEKTYHVKRSTKILDKVKDELWVKSKSYKRKEQQDSLFK